MSSAENHLQIENSDAHYPDVSDDSRQRDVGTIVHTTSAAPAGCWADEDEPEANVSTIDDSESDGPAGCLPVEDAEAIADLEAHGSLSVNAQGGPSDPSSSEISASPADSIKSQRDFEAFLRNSGFSRAASKAIATNGWRTIGETETDDEDRQSEMISELIGLFRT
jgi:hypothetical protein